MKDNEKMIVTIQQEYALTADSVRKCRMNMQKSFCEANFDGFLHVIMKVLNNYK